MSLTTYKNGDFSKSSEPHRRTSRDKITSSLSFVVQRHHFTHRYYDFCIEVNGVLKSWAVPRGPSMNPWDKRLAMMIDDHPCEFDNVEEEKINRPNDADIIEIWDFGTYIPMDKKGNVASENYVENAIERGNVNFFLHGNKLKGEFTLVKLHQDDDKAWLLIKQR